MRLRSEEDEPLGILGEILALRERVDARDLGQRVGPELHACVGRRDHRHLHVALRVERGPLLGAAVGQVRVDQRLVVFVELGLVVAHDRREQAKDLRVRLGLARRDLGRLSDRYMTP